MIGVPAVVGALCIYKYIRMLIKYIKAGRFLACGVSEFYLILSRVCNSGKEGSFLLKKDKTKFVGLFLRALFRKI